ncbi:Zinc finger BED domain-containing protein RICESLEEPER 1 [Linum grandiflorum]
MFDILGWWKTNSVKYPVLSDISRDILVVPISTVPPETALVPAAGCWTHIGIIYCRILLRP